MRLLTPEQIKRAAAIQGRHAEERATLMGQQENERRQLQAKQEDELLAERQLYDVAPPPSETTAAQPSPANVLARRPGGR